MTQCLLHIKSSANPAKSCHFPPRRPNNAFLPLPLALMPIEISHKCGEGETYKLSRNRRTKLAKFEHGFISLGTLQLEGEPKEKNEGDHHVEPQLFQHDMEHCGKVPSCCEAVPSILEDEAKIGKGDSNGTSCCGRALSSIFFRIRREIALAY